MTNNKREPFHWRTNIAYKTQPKIVIRGYDLNELVGNLDLAEMAYLVWRGELPSEAHGRMLNAIMVCLAEHAFSPSAASARFVASGGRIVRSVRCAVGSSRNGTVPLRITGRRPLIRAEKTRIRTGPRR